MSRVVPREATPSAPPRAGRRRALLIAGVGAAAAAGGIALALRREAQEPAPSALWSTRLARAGGGEIDFGKLRGQPLLLNFWATWCAPCVTEMPLLESFHRERRAAGWQVVGVAVDREAPVLGFMTEHAISFPVALAGAAGLELARSLGNGPGGLPFTAVFRADGRRLGSHLGAVDPAMLAGWVAGSR